MLKRKHTFQWATLRLRWYQRQSPTLHSVQAVLEVEALPVKKHSCSFAIHSFRDEITHLITNFK